MSPKSDRSFQELIKSEMTRFLDINNSIYPAKDTFRIDLHCHDLNSNVPDEILGRILNLSETWLPTENLISTLKKHGMEAFTITNHNNARSCFEMLDKGFDILVGAEFSCIVPDYQVGIHVLTYGFNPGQDQILNKLRKNIYSFLDYTLAESLPTIWAHPLYHYGKSSTLPIDFFNKMTLLFERFEVLNGQRDTWQNMLIKRWIENLTEEKIHEISKKSGIAPDRYCKIPFRKSMAGGSDSHMGIFSGLTGTLLYVEDLEEKRKKKKLSDLALEAIRDGRMAAFGSHNNSEKMMITFLDYVCQIAINGEDPGLLRIVLHNGEIGHKITALLVANGFSELRQHRVTMNFINLFHDSLTGIEPHFTKRWMMPKPYKPIFDQVRKMAQTFQTKPELAVNTYSESINRIYGMLGNTLAERISDKIGKLKLDEKLKESNLNELISGLELPSELRTYLGINKSIVPKGRKKKKSTDAAGFLDGLSFPFLASSVILSAHFTSALVLYKNRPLLNDFSRELGYLEHPKRMLWLTDTWNDNNGTSMVLKSVLDEIRNRNLPIDIMICCNNLKSEDHLLVVAPQSEMQISFIKDQKIRIPDFLQIHNKFFEGEYDRVMCSTEGPMGLAGLYLKYAYSVPAFFYMHTDWKNYSKRALKLDKENHSRLIRLLRAYYKAFNALFVLNTDDLNWLTDKKMSLHRSSLFLTANWPGSHFFPRPASKKQLFKTRKEHPVLLYTGRISYERGVMELPGIYRAVRSVIPKIHMVIAGKGPAEEQLKRLLPEAVYLGWIDQTELPAIYSSADLLIHPSKFETFSSAILEALSCGLPVIAYNTKSPKDIIRHGVNGLLVINQAEMIQQTIAYLNNSDLQEKMRRSANEISKDYNSDKIIQRFLYDTGLVV
jgi:glycosyltransferase involved in cell wall biosynthesis